VLRRVSDDHPRPLRKINPDVPPWLESLIARLMAKEPSDRYQTADEAFDVLKKCLAHVQQPLSTSLPAGLQPRTRVRRGNTVMLMAVAFFAIALVPTAIAVRTWLSSPRDSSATTKPSFPGDSPDLDPWQAGPADDKIRQLIDQSHFLAEQTKKDMLRTDETTCTDSIAMHGFYLMREAEAIEREIQSNQSTPPDPNAPISTPSPFNRR
jgi:hypothetical protein